MLNINKILVLYIITLLPFLNSCNIGKENVELKQNLVEKKILQLDEEKKEKDKNDIENPKIILKKEGNVKKEKLQLANKKQSTSNSVVFEFKNERYLEGMYEKKYEKNLKIAEKAIQATFKMFTKVPSTGMEKLTFSKSFQETKPINYSFKNYYDSLSDKKNTIIEKTVLVLLPHTGPYKDFGINLRRSIDLGLLEEDRESIKFLYFDTGKNFKNENILTLIQKSKPNLILGPLLRENLVKLKLTVRNLDIPVISFTNDHSLSEDNIWVTGFSPEDQINKLIAYSKKCKREKLGFIGIDNEYGNLVLKFIKRKLKNNVLAETILLQKETLSNKKILNLELKNFLGFKEKSDENDIFIPKFDSIFLIGNTNFVLEVMPILTFYDLDLEQTDILGTSILNDELLINEHSLINAKFPIVEQNQEAVFEKKWNSMWFGTPNELARLGYDLSKISIWLVNQELTFKDLIRKNKNKFAILGNKFQFYNNGHVFRPSKLFKINSLGKVKEVVDCS